MKKDLCYVVGAGEFYNHKITRTDHDLVIAVDGGYDYLNPLNIQPDIVIGDFDSLQKKPIHPHIIELPKEKDDTDMAAALNEGLKQGYKNFKIYGGMGGRFSHTIANIQCLAYLAENNAQGFLYGENEVTTAIANGCIEFDSSHSGYISVFAHSDIAEGVCLKGLKYKLDNATLSNKIPLGISNEFIGEDSSISVEKGILIIITPIM